MVAVEEEKQRLEAEKALLEEENHALAEAVDELFDYSSIVRIAKFNKVSEILFSWRKLKAVSQKMGKEIKRVPSPRYESKTCTLTMFGGFAIQSISYQKPPPW